MHYHGSSSEPTWGDIMSIQAEYKSTYGAIVAIKLAPLGGHSSHGSFGLRISVYTVYGTKVCDRYPGWYIFPSDHATTLAGFVYRMLILVPEDVLMEAGEIYRSEVLEAQ